MITEQVWRVPFVSTQRNAHGKEEVIRGTPVEAYAAFDPGGSYDALDGLSQRVVSQPTLYMEYGQESHRMDQWRVRGLLYDVDGDTAGWSAGGWDAGLVIKLRRATG